MMTSAASGSPIDLHSVPHIIDAEHFLVACITTFWIVLKIGDRQEVVFNVMHARTKADALSLATTRAVNHTVDAVAIFSKAAS